MEIHLFKTRDVEQKLDEICDLLYLLQHSIIGLESMRTLSQRDAGGFLITIESIIKVVNELNISRKTISRGVDEEQIKGMITMD
jgi:hypothetical protein